MRDAGGRLITQIVMSASPSDTRAVKNFRSDMRRCGINE